MKGEGDMKRRGERKKPKKEGNEGGKERKHVSSNEGESETEKR